jgi:MraZ protein
VLDPESVWNEQMDMVRSRLNRYNQQHQQIFRQFVSQVELLTLDGNGRFLIPKRYLQLADIQQSIKFTGNGDTIEIWAAEKVEASMMSAADFGAAMQSVMDGELPPL